MSVKCSMSFLCNLISAFPIFDNVVLKTASGTAKQKFGPRRYVFGTYRGLLTV